MKKLAIALATLKAYVVSLVLTLAIGLLFARIAKANEWLFSDCCVDGAGNFVSALRFWSAYWWLTFILIFYPVFLSFFIFFIRRFVAAGHRLTAVGFIFIFHGVTMFTGVIGTSTSEFGHGSLISLPVYLSIAAVLLLGGGYLGWIRARSA